MLATQKLAVVVGWLLASGLVWGAEGAAPRIDPSQAAYLFWHLTPAEGATPEQATTVEKSIRSFFEAQRGKALMDAQTMDSLLVVEGNEKFLRCGTGPMCLSGLGEAAGVPWIIAGELSLIQGRVRVELVLVDRIKQTVASRVRVEGSTPLTQTQLDELALAMFEPDRYRGAIEVSCAVAGAEVLVDGRKAGVTPLVGPLTNLPAGVRRLEVRKPGHQSFRREVRVPIGGLQRVEVMLPEQATLVRPEKIPFQRSWMFWTFGGVGVAALAVAVGLHLDGNQLQENADALEALNLRRWHEVQDDANGRFLGAYIGYGIGAAGLLAAGVVAILDLVGSSGSEATSPPVHSFVMGFGASPSGAVWTATWRF